MDTFIFLQFKRSGNPGRRHKKSKNRQGQGLNTSKWNILCDNWLFYVSITCPGKYYLRLDCFFVLHPTHNFLEYQNDEKTCREIFLIHILLDVTHITERWERLVGGGPVKITHLQASLNSWNIRHNTKHIFPVKKITPNRLFTEMTKIASRIISKLKKTIWLFPWESDGIRSLQIAIVSETLILWDLETLQIARVYCLQIHKENSPTTA